MSCGACEDIMSDFCPCCHSAPEPEEVECTFCHGTGLHYYDENGNDLTFEEWEKLPADEKLCDPCPECKGDKIYV